MRAFLDPNWNREFGQAVVDRDVLPSRRTQSELDGFSRRAPVHKRLELLADPQKAATAARNGATRPRRKKNGNEATVVAQAQRELWKTQVKDWLRAHDRGADWELPKCDEKVLFEWFEAIDIDRSGTVDAEEVRKLLAANHVGSSPARKRVSRLRPRARRERAVATWPRPTAGAMFLLWKDTLPVMASGVQKENAAA